MHLLIRTVLGALLNAGILAGTVHAQPAVPKPDTRGQQREREAEAHFERGKTLYAGRQLTAAMEAFTASYRLVPTANVAFNIGQISELLERIEDAFNWYEVCLTFRAEDTLRRAEERLEALAPRVAALAVTAQPPDALIAIDGVEQGAIVHPPRILAVTPGHHRLSARHAGSVAGETTVEARRGSVVSVALSLEPLPGTLTVESVPAGATVWLHPNMALLGTTPLSTQLPVGPARLSLRLDGHDAREVTTQIRSAAVTMLSLSLVPRRLPEHAVAKSDADRRVAADRSPTTGLGDLRWVGYGAGAALLVTGGVLGALALDKHDEVQMDPERRDKDELTRLNLAADLTIGTGLLLAAVTLTLDLLLTESTNHGHKPLPSRQ